MPNLFLNADVFSYPSFETKGIQNLNLESIDFIGLERQKYLGKRAEFFMRAYLEKHPNFDPVYHSLQVQDEKITLGELDFLFFDKAEKEWIHLELVCKFYIFTGENKLNGLEHWIGPNLKDRLDKKIQKLKTHQLQICKRFETQKLLKSLEIDPLKVKSKICYKAKLFLPQNALDFNFSAVNSNCIKGEYYHFENFKALKYNTDLFYIPEKPEWLCLPENHKNWYGYDKACQILKSSFKDKRSQMLWRKTKNDEYFEDFVVWW